jgi:hypothetical protein
MMMENLVEWRLKATEFSFFSFRSQCSVKFANVSEVCTYSIFRIGEQAKEANKWAARERPGPDIDAARRFSTLKMETVLCPETLVKFYWMASHPRTQNGQRALAYTNFSNELQTRQSALSYKRHRPNKNEHESTKTETNECNVAQLPWSLLPFTWSALQFTSMSWYQLNQQKRSWR